MANNYWMKLWFDILRDPKIGMLPDRLWRRVIELFLLAGQHGEEGKLPDISEIAWQLNKSIPAIKTDLENIEKTGIVSQTESGEWIVTNFKKRNEPVDSAKRIKDFRHRERYEKSNASDNAGVTEMKRECNEALQLRYQEEQKNRSTEEQINTTAAAEEKFVEIAKAYEDVIGSLTGFTAEQLKSAINEYEPSWIIDALKEAATANVRKWAYVEAILKRWKTDGRNSKRANTKQQTAPVDKFRKAYEQVKQ